MLQDFCMNSKPNILHTDFFWIRIASLFVWEPTSFWKILLFKVASLLECTAVVSCPHQKEKACLQVCIFSFMIPASSVLCKQNMAISDFVNEKTNMFREPLLWGKHVHGNKINGLKFQSWNLKPSKSSNFFCQSVPYIDVKLGHKVPTAGEWVGVPPQVMGWDYLFKLTCSCLNASEIILTFGLRSR